MATEHEQLHRVATQMLNASRAGEPIPVRDYNGFVNAATRLRLETLSVSREFEDGLTNLDPLTGATSRERMLIVIRKQREIVKRDLQSCAIAMMDLDLFKKINDDYGHQAGDLVLTSTAHYVMTHLRPYDEFFRYGGDEFLLCSPGTDLRAAIDTIERLREGIAMLRIDINDGRELQATASFGITLLDPDVSVEESIARADQALYRAKSAGRNQICVWDSLTS
jgi:diguanylate cyclase (GGDEF)-like protein